MDTSTSEFIKNAVGSGVRWLLVLAAGILVKKGVISTEQSDVYVQQAMPVVIGAVMAAIALVWGIWQKKHANLKIDKALALPAGTDREVLEKKV
jgi:hypothetical protein